MGILPRLSTAIAALVILVGVRALPAAAVTAAEWETVTVPPAADAPATAATTNGPAWYRCFVRVPDNMTSRADGDLMSDSVTLSLAGINAPFTVHLNGKRIIESGPLADEPRRRFKVPKGILEAGAFNVLALRIDAEAAADAALRRPPILAGYFDELVLEGQWQVLGVDQVDSAALAPVKEQPKTAAYLETGFRQSSTPLSADSELMPGRKLSPEQSLATMTTPDDLTVELMLAEPLVAQPTHLSFDERGRLWVSQYRQYPYPAGIKMISRDKYYRGRYDKVPPAPPKHDRGRDIISVHEDTDGDGKFDRNKVVLDGLNMANAAVRGRGGIWVMHSPYLMFYPDADGDDVPDRDPEVRLAGFGLEDTHSAANGLIWGPDGWLYGTQGSTVTSRVTRPGVEPANAPGIYYNGSMVWRYHPDTKVYELFSEGGGNNFGLEFDAEGRLYCGHNGGTTRGWHFVQAGLYMKQGNDPSKYGPPPNPYAFGGLTMMASANPIPRFTHEMIVYEGTALPARYVGGTIGVDPLHRNLVAAERRRVGPTFTTADTGVPLAGADIAFRPVYLTAGPDGAVYVADFYEEFIAHGQNYQGQIDPTTGRVYRLRGKEAKLNTDVNLSARSAAELVGVLSHANRWHRQTSVRLLGERRDPATVAPLKALLQTSQAHPSLEALWALHQMGALDEATARAALDHPAPPVRAWAVRLMGDARQLSETFASAVRERVMREEDAEVRSQIASTTRMLPADQALPIVAALLRRDADAGDPFVPMLCWWTIESHCDSNRDAVLALLDDPGTWDLAVVRHHILGRLMRRLGSKGTRADFLACANLLKRAPRNEHRKLLMAGFEEAFKGRALPPLPHELASALAESGHASPALRVRLGEPAAITGALKQVTDRQGTPEELLTTVTLLGEVKVPEAVPGLLAIARADGTSELRKAALTALLLYDGEAIGAEVVAAYPSLPVDVRPAAQNLLASRPAWSAAFLKLVEAGTIKPTEVSPDVVDRLRGQPEAGVGDLTAKLFPAPTVAPDRAEKVAAIQRMQRIIAQVPGDPYKGEPIFMERCASCHTLFFKGGNIGPNLTSYQRDDLGTMLTSILEPSAEIREGFATFVVRTKDRRVLSGFQVDNDAAVVVLRGSDGQDVRVPRDEIALMKPAAASLMPEGLLEGLNDQQIRDLFAYLRIPQPITK